MAGAIWYMMMMMMHILLNTWYPYLGCWVDGELQLGLLAVLGRQLVHEQGGESRASATTESMKYEESLQDISNNGDVGDDDEPAELHTGQQVF